MILKHKTRILLIMLFGVFSVQAEQSPRYRIFELLPGEATELSVFHGFMRKADHAEIIVVKMIEDQKRLLQVFVAHEGAYDPLPVLELQLPDNVIHIEMGRIGDADSLVLFTAHEATLLDPISGERRRLIEFSSIYNVPAKGSLPEIDVMRDLNDDGLDDFIIPGFTGYSIYIQNPRGQFIDAVKLSIPPVMEMTYNEYPLYKLRKIYHVDLNADGRKDLAFWDNDHLVVYPQTPEGRFSIATFNLSPQVKFDEEGFDGVSMQMGEGDQSDIEKKALFEIKDFDQDGYPELVTLKVKSKGVFKKRTTYEFHRGLSSPESVKFSIQPESKIESRGIQFEMQEHDLNGDDQIDIVVFSVEIRLGTLIKALLLGSVDIDLSFYQMVDGRYPKKPNLVREITATFDFSSGDVYIPTVLITDVTGDGLADLLVQDGPKKLKLYAGRNDKRLFERRAEIIKVAMPNSPDNVHLADLNRDKKKDIIIIHQSAEGMERLLVLLSR